MFVELWTNVGIDVEGIRVRTYPRIVKRMLISRSAPQPATRKTPTGGTKGCHYV